MEAKLLHMVGMAHLPIGNIIPSRNGKWLSDWIQRVFKPQDRTIPWWCMYYLYPLGGGLMICFFVQKYTSLTRIAKDSPQVQDLAWCQAFSESQALVHTEDVQKEKIVSIGIFIITWARAWSDELAFYAAWQGRKQMVKCHGQVTMAFRVVYGHPSRNGYVTSYWILLMDWWPSPNTGVCILYIYIYVIQVLTIECHCTDGEYRIGYDLEMPSLLMLADVFRVSQVGTLW